MLPDKLREGVATFNLQDSGHLLKRRKDSVNSFAKALRGVRLEFVAIHQ
jgi:hypothetical protein